MEGLYIKVSEPQAAIKKEYFFRLVASVLFITGWVWLSMSAFSFLEVAWMWMALIGILLATGFVYLFNSKRSDYILTAGCLMGVLCLVMGFSYAKNGVYVYINEVLRFSTGNRGKIYLDYPVQSETGIWLVGVLVVFFLALFSTYAICKHCKWLMLFLTVPTVLGYMIGFLSSEGAWIVIAASFALVVFLQNGDTDVYSGYSKWISLGLLVVSIGISGIVGILGQEISSDAVADGIQEQIHALRYGCEDTSMPEGDLSNLGGWKKNDVTALELTTEHPEKLYIRGMIGERYTGLAWEDHEQETNIAAEAMFYWLHEVDFYGQTSIGNGLSVLEKSDAYEMTIKNNNACGLYQYLPYAIADNRTMQADAIGSKSSHANEATQTILCYPGSVPEWYQLEMDLAKQQKQKEIGEYLRYEQTYREFVFEHDLQLTNAAIGVCQRIFGETTETRSLYQIQKLILETLESAIEYNESITTSNGGNDFFQYTMEQSNQGYSVHYATAATLMFRYFGVPARYVEGYFLSADEAQLYEAGDIILLNEGHAHAWTEYYLDGVGWIPFEVTPGYMDEDEMMRIEQIMQDNSSNSSEHGGGGAQNKLQYTPPKYAPEDRKVTELTPTFRLQVKHVAGVLLFLLIAALVMGLIYVLKRKRKLFRVLDEIHQMDHQNAITALFGYANMLMERAHIEELDGLDEIRHINREAMFSNHEMTAHQREKTELFAVKVIRECRKKWNAWERFRYHYILWLYR